MNQNLLLKSLVCTLALLFCIEANAKELVQEIIVVAPSPIEASYSQHKSDNLTPTFQYLDGADYLRKTSAFLP